MTEKNINITLKIKFKSPFIIGTGFGAAGIIDQRTAKDANGVIYIPATSIKGKIKAEFRKIMHSLGEYVCGQPGGEICKGNKAQEPCVICRIFGSEFYEGMVFFEDARMDNNPYNLFKEIEARRVIPQSQAAIRTGIRLDRRFKTAAEEALFILEAANPCPVFTALIHGAALLSEEEYKFFCQTIRSITHLGGDKARGLGRCEITVNEGAS